MTELLLGTTLNEQQRQYAGLIKTSAALLTTLINDVLDFSKIEAGKLELEQIEFDMQHCVEEVIQLLSDKATRKKVELGCYFKAGAPRLVRGDPTRLRQILVNLVNNALKFTETGSVIVTAEVIGQDDQANTVKFCVNDTGIGIPAERRDRLFKAFSQVDASTTRKYGGTGLGLAISKQLTELMGGDIGVESEEGRGSTFWFTARFGKAAQQPVNEQAKSPRDLRILIVDDSAAHRDLLYRQVESWGMNFAGAATAADAIVVMQEAEARGKRFHVALVDYELPQASGIELARLIHRDTALRHTATLAMLPMDANINEGDIAAAGFAGWVSKPVRQSQLLDSIMNAAAGKTKSPTFAMGLPAESPAAKRGARILIAEDNEVNQILARELLKRAGHEFHVVDNGRKALEAWAGGKFDLILMDCQMPEMDGLEATRAIRQRETAENLARIPIIALTANAMTGDREICLAAGMDGYCSKPLDPKQLFPMIDSLLPKQAAAKASAIDLDKLLETCTGDRDLAEILLNKFQQQLERDLAALEQTVRDRDATATAKAAHSLKGSAAMIAAAEVAQAALKLEKLGREQKVDEFADALAQLRGTCATCANDLRKIQMKSVNTGGLACVS